MIAVLFIAAAYLPSADTAASGPAKASPPRAAGSAVAAIPPGVAIEGVGSGNGDPGTAGPGGSQINPPTPDSDGIAIAAPTGQPGRDITIPVDSVGLPGGLLPQPGGNGDLPSAILGSKRAADLALGVNRARPERSSRQTIVPDPDTSGAVGPWQVAPTVTWYGPGFYNRRTACGQRYTREIIGVAHKTLPCGTMIRFRWHGIEAVVPVIDRGPYGTPDMVFDFSAALSCDVFKEPGVKNACFTRHDVRWQIVSLPKSRQS